MGNKIVVPTPIAGVRLTYQGQDLKRIYIHEQFLPLLQQVLDRLRLRAGLVAIETLGIYNLRKARRSSRLSQHAYASAIDLAGFRVQHLPEPIRVDRDWTTRRPFFRLLEQECLRASAGHRYEYVTPDDDPDLHNDHIHWGIWPDD
ncbi:extensin family protein [Thermogutta sp.]|uniref:extensin family protein n=1 Tax=Thermogutta sp. TaxID=1962930 RepID=UPI00321F941F